MNESCQSRCSPFLDISGIHEQSSLDDHISVHSGVCAACVLIFLTGSGHVTDRCAWDGGQQPRVGAGSTAAAARRVLVRPGGAQLAICKTSVSNRLSAQPHRPHKLAQLSFEEGETAVTKQLPPTSLSSDVLELSKRTVNARRLSREGLILPRGTLAAARGATS